MYAKSTTYNEISFKKVQLSAEELDEMLQKRKPTISFLDKNNKFIFIFLIYFFNVVACTQSGNPRSEELIKTSVPTFSGNQNASFSTGTVLYTLNGECDTISKGLEWSYDNSSWTSIAGGCAAGAFSIIVSVPTFVNVYVRALTKKGYTTPGIAHVQLILPPTTATFQFVTAGNASSFVGGLPGINFTMSGTTTGNPGTSGSHNLETHLTGLVYGH